MNRLDYLSSNAHKFDYEVNTEETAQLKTVRKQKKKALTGFKKFILTASLFAVVFSIISGYVKLDEAKNNALMLQKELKSITADNQLLQQKIDSAVDLSLLQKKAVEEYGMVKPERSQTIYVDITREDYSERKGKDEPTGKLKLHGVTGTLINSIHILH